MSDAAAGLVNEAVNPRRVVVGRARSAPLDEIGAEHRRARAQRTRIDPRAPKRPAHRRFRCWSRETPPASASAPPAPSRPPVGGAVLVTRRRRRRTAQRRSARAAPRQTEREVGWISASPAPGERGQLLAIATSQLHHASSIPQPCSNVGRPPLEQAQLGPRDAVPGEMADRVEQRRPQRVVEKTRRQLPWRLLQVEPRRLRQRRPTYSIDFAHLNVA